MKRFATLATFAACLSVGAHAQNIERVKMTDNDLNCQMMYQEIIQMDGVIARASQPVAPMAMAAPAAADSNAGAQVAGAVVQTAIAQRGFGGFGGGFGGGLGGMLGGLASQAQQGAAQQAAAQAVAQQQAQANAAAQASQNAMLSQQAQGRKEHLTGLFLGKGCKMSDIQK